MASAEILSVTTEKLFCDGGNDVSGHPRVYLTMTKQGAVDCPYCGRHFVLDHAAASSHEH